MLIITRLLLSLVTTSPHQFQVEWTKPSPGPGHTTGKAPLPTYMDAMPLGNGRVTVLGWANITNGGVAFYLGSQEAMSSQTELFKLALVDIAITPNPMATAGATFNQTLDIATGSLRITLGDFNLFAFVDANSDALFVNGSGPTPFSISIASTSTRPTTPWSHYSGSTCKTPTSNPDVYVDPIPSTAFAFRNPGPNPLPFKHASGDQRPLRTLADLPPFGAFQPASIISYHRNDVAEGENLADIFAEQGISSIVKTTPDWWVDRQSGFVLTAETDASPLKRIDAHTLVSVAPSTSFALRATILAVQTATEAEWMADVAAMVAKQQDVTVAIREHDAWWSTFWNRSHIHVNATRWPAAPLSPPAPTPDVGFLTSKMYAITRYVQAIQSRGTMWPIKFNGMGFIAAMGTNGEADSRDWGACNWWQNTRLPYGAMLSAGDFDTFEVILDYKLNQEVMLSQRTPLYWGHQGMWTTETSHLTGAYCSADYGCSRKPGYPVAIEQNKYIHVGQGGDAGGPEYSLMAMDYLLWSSADPTAPTQSAKDYLRIATQNAEYFMHHFKNKSADGRVLIWPTQVLETYWCTYNLTLNAWVNCCENDSPTITGMMILFEKLLSLPPGLATPAQTAAWTNFRTNLMPKLPITTTSKGGPTIALAEVVSKGVHNAEGPTLYAMHPHRVFTKGRSVATGLDITLGENTVKNGFDAGWGSHGAGWGYGINA